MAGLHLRPTVKRRHGGAVLESPYVLLGTLDEMAATIEARREPVGHPRTTCSMPTSVDASTPLVTRLADT